MKKSRQQRRITMRWRHLEIAVAQAIHEDISVTHKIVAAIFEYIKKRINTDWFYRIPGFGRWKKWISPNLPPLGGPKITGACVTFRPSWQFQYKYLYDVERPTSLVYEIKVAYDRRLRQRKRRERIEAGTATELDKYRYKLWKKRFQLQALGLEWEPLTSKTRRQTSRKGIPNKKKKEDKE